ncbi:MAG: hypothetical protein JHC95_13595, partial [Solirubrobacteraceae bacterium]|nr:hypothetical protein [Solirubrobacteraceae bacterium]
ASTFTAISGAKAGDQVTLTKDISLVVGSVTSDGTTATLSGATVQLGSTISGSGVSGTATATELKLTGGRFTVPKSLDDEVYTIDPQKPLVFALAESGATAVSGELTNTGEKAGSAAGLRAFATVTEPDVAAAIPPPPTGSNYSIKLNFYLERITATVKLGDTQIVYGQIQYAGSYWFDLTYPFSFKGQNVLISGRLSGSNIFQPASYKVSGSITGQIELVKGVYLTGGSVSLSAKEISFAGSVKLDCAEGSVSAGASGTVVDDKNWSLKVDGGTAPAGCTVTKDLKLPAGSILGEIGAVDGKVTGLFELTGKVSTTLLPAGVNEWDAGFRFIYDGTDAGSYIGFVAKAGIGVAQGKIGFDGTFGLNADFTIPFGGSSVAFNGTINRLTPNGAVDYNVGGSANLVINSQTSLGGSVKLTNTSLSLAGDVTLACPVSGSITGGVNGTVPIGSGKDWSFAISGGAGSKGCQVTKEFGLAAGSGLSGSVKSTGGVVAVAADANATINTTLIPTKSSFSVGFKFAASQGAYNVAVSGSTQGAGFSAAVASTGTFDLSFNLDDLALGGVTLGAKGSIKRTTPSGAVSYSISGSLAGQAKIYDNLYIRGGALSIDSVGGLKFTGTIRQICTSGYLDASATGIITDSRNWAFDAKGIASQCTIGRAAKFDGTTFYAQIKSENAKVLYNAGVKASRINLFSTWVFPIGTTTTWLTEVGGTISNTCPGCLDGQKTRLSFGASAYAQFRIILLPVQIGITLSGQVDIMGNSVRRVGLALNRQLFLSQFAQNQIEIDTQKAFTTA